MSGFIGEENNIWFMIYDLIERNVQKIFPYIISYSEKEVVLSTINISVTWNKLASSAKVVDGCFFCLCNITNNTHLTWSKKLITALLFLFTFMSQR